jgi:hypothetical protein
VPDLGYYIFNISELPFPTFLLRPELRKGGNN